MRPRILAAACACLLSSPVLADSGPPGVDIRLVVQITVDGLRGDLLDRYWSDLRPNGFRRLIDTGLWYTNAHHDHANTETIVGHATLATGAHPSEHGMIGNAWFDRGTGRLGYNIEDQRYPLLPVPGFGGTVDQLDPAQAIAAASGRSPANLLATTFSDELSKATLGKAKVFGVSGKDRSAVAMGGHAGKAFWMSAATGAYETSRFYYEAYPDWAVTWNAARPADAAIGTNWELTDPPESYRLLDNDDRPFETDLRGFGRTFPHPYGDPEDGLYYTQVLLSPLGDQLTADFALEAVRAEGLGQDEVPDFLGVSFSGVDATSHIFGPASLEHEEMVRALDRTLASFFAEIEGMVGGDAVLYVLSADHGMPEAPEAMEALGFSAARNDPREMKAALNLLVEERLGVEDAIREFFRPYIYLDHKAIAAAGVETREIERLLVDELMGTEGIWGAFPAAPVPEQRGDWLEGPIRRNYHPARSGDLYVVQAPYAYLQEGGAIAVMHGSPWRYDTHVPIIFSHPGLDTGRVTRRVSTTDVAITLSAILGTPLPSAASGEVLSEVLSGRGDGQVP